MPAEFFALLLSPFGQFSYGCDLLDQLPRPSFFPIELEGEQSLLVCFSNFFTICFTPAFISQRLYSFEPFLNPFRLTNIQSRSPESANMGFGKKRKR